VQSLNSNGLATVAILNDIRFNLLRQISSEELTSKELSKHFHMSMHKIDSGVQKFTQDSLTINSHLCRSYNSEENYKLTEDKLFINGPLLTANIFAILLGTNGSVRATGLGEINQWKTVLKHLKKVVWMNAEVVSDDFDMLKNNHLHQKNDAAKLLKDVEIVRTSCMSIENENFSDFNKDFWLVIEKLKKVSLEEGAESWHRNFAMNSLRAIIELNLITFLPLMDPVKKNQLKTRYLREDMDHLERLLTSFKFMSIIMDYENLGKETRKLLLAEIEIIQEKLVKHSKKIAVRPEVCIYSSLVKDVNHFLSSCCHPKNLLDLVNEIGNVLEFKVEYKDVTKSRRARTIKAHMDELACKLDLWIINANKFESHTMQVYQAFYRDFVSPIESSITSLKNGLTGLRAVLKTKNESIRTKESGKLWDVNENGELCSFMNQLLEFPSKITINVIGEKNQKVNIFGILEGVDHSESIYMKLVNAKMQEIQNTSSVFRSLTNHNFKAYDAILNVCNQIWQKQENLKRKRQAEEDSLYVTKTKCLEEDEETVKLREIAEIFPNYAEDDFDEFLQNDTLEQVIKIDKAKKTAPEIVGNDDYKIIADFFTTLMDVEVESPVDYLSVFEAKLKVLHPIFEEYKFCVDISLDDTAYKSLSLLIGLCQSSYDGLTLKGRIKNVGILNFSFIFMFIFILPTTDPSLTYYNFYKDSNITEAMSCVEVMKKLEQRVKVELEQFPDHAVLNDVSNFSLSFVSPSTLTFFSSVNHTHEPDTWLCKQLTARPFQHRSSNLAQEG
jgi:midasin